MIGIIFVVLAVIYLARRPRINALQSYQFPYVSRHEFERWKQCELWSIDIFLVTCLLSTLLTMGAFVIGITMSQSAAQPGSMLQSLPVVGMIGGIVVFVVGLIASAVFGSMGAGLKKRLGIEAPK
ncbi:MAG: hypothetical protein M3Y56_12000 [Armatimonadota bacterium]|nr:hypothetical protein [Armatimonadota bacterium]